jgi:hypothetical protein
MRLDCKPYLPISSVEARKAKYCVYTPPCIFMVRYLIKRKENFTSNVFRT